MRFFHISDLHLGKMLHHVPLTETDQAFWVERFLETVDEYRPDAVVIAGDIYDRRVPPVEAVRLFDRLLTGLAGRGIYVFVIPGNHDSAVRLSHVSELLETHRIYIAGELSRELMHVTVPGHPSRDLSDAVASSTEPSPDVTFWLLPYLFPKAAADRHVLDRDDLESYDEAARELLALQEISPEGCNVLVAHQNVLAHGVKPEHSESETIIGGIGEIDYTAFDAFDYVALGHIHNAQKVGRETIRYSGCPLYYDFSEACRSKDLTMVTIRSKKEISVERIHIPLLHTLLQMKGTLKELLQESERLEDRQSRYIQCILTDKHVPPRAMEKLRDVFGDSLVNVKREIRPEAGDPQERADGGGVLGQEEGAVSGPGLVEQFEQFYQEQTDELPDADQEAVLQKILEQQARRGEDYLLKMSDIPQEDSQELLETVLQGRRSAH